MDATVIACLLLHTVCTIVHIPGPETRGTVYRCICSNSDRLGVYRRIQIIIGTVCFNKYQIAKIPKKKMSHNFLFEMDDDLN